MSAIKQLLACKDKSLPAAGWYPVRRHASIWASSPGSAPRRAMPACCTTSYMSALPFTVKADQGGTRLHPPMRKHDSIWEARLSLDRSQ